MEVEAPVSPTPGVLGREVPVGNGEGPEGFRPMSDTSLAQGEVVQVAAAPARPREASKLLLGLLCSVSSLEGADVFILPSVSLALQVDVKLTLDNLSTIILFQALCQTIVAPFWGILADGGVMKRKTILTMGCILNGLVTMSVSLASALPVFIVCRSLNGAMLASLRPVSNGIVADVTDETKRGKAYGWVMLTMNVGSQFSTIVCTNLSTVTVFGFQGWRVACIAIGAYGICVGLAVAMCITEPPREFAHLTRPTLRGELSKLISYLRLPTFAIMVIQGCFGMVPINAFSYRTLYFQLVGLGNGVASALQSVGMAAAAVGNLLGGLVGDCFARRCPMHGRVFVAQITILSGIPVVFLTFMIDPPNDDAWAIVWYIVLLVAFGLAACWCATGVNWPILSEIVPPQNRNTVLAWETALEGSCGAALGNAMVGFLATKVFGYDLKAQGGDHADPEARRSLGRALTMTTFLPYLVCFAFYSLLHWSYPRDIARVLANKGSKVEPEEVAEQQADGPEQRAQQRSPEAAEEQAKESVPQDAAIPRLWKSAQAVSTDAGAR